MELDTLVGKQASAFHLSNKRLNIYEGSVRSSKTVTSLLRWCQYIMHEAPPGPLIMIGKTERTLKQNILDPLAEIIGKKNVKVNRGTGEIIILGRLCYGVGANDERAGDKIRGITLAGAYCDEIGIYPESFVSLLVSRISVKDAKLFATCNPEGPNHWLLADYLSKPALHLTGDGRLKKKISGELDLFRASFRLDDNRSLDPAYVSALKKELTGVWYKRFILGEWSVAEGVIYDMFDPDLHVVTEIPRMSRWFVGLDYGTTNPFHAVLIGLGVDESLYVVSEWRWDSKKQGKQKTDAAYSRDLRRWLENQNIDPDYVCVDPSAASFIQQLYYDHVRGVTKADNKVIDGIRLTGSLFSQKKLFINESCKHLIDELLSYCWDTTASNAGKDQPVKFNDHGADALRYGLKTTEAIWSSIVRS